MKTLLLFVQAFLILTSCQTKNSDKSANTQNPNPCLGLKDSVRTNVIFSQADTVLPTKDFYDIIKFIESKGSMRLQTDNKIPLKIDYWKDIYLTHITDTCNHRYLTQFFVLKNVTASSCYFISTKLLKGTKNYYPRFNFIQWNFANNSDRDSAYKIMKWVYNNDDVIAYDYRYNQTVFADKRLYMFETNALVFAETNEEYASYLRDYVNKTSNGH